MKKARIIFTALLITLFLSSCEDNTSDQIEDISSVKIGELKNGNLTITYDQDNILEKYNKFSKKNGISTKFTYLEIQELDIESNKKYYGLFAYNKDESVRSVTLLSLKNNVLSFYRIDDGATITCTTTACSNNSGCTPHQATNDLGISYWTCTSCSDGTCTKTTTVNLK